MLLDGSALAGSPIAGGAPLSATVRDGALLGFGAIGAAPLAGWATVPVILRGGALLGFGPLASVPLAGFSQPSVYVVRPAPRVFVLVERREDGGTWWQRALRRADLAVFRPPRGWPAQTLEPPPFEWWLLRNARGFNPTAPAFFPIVWVNT